MNTPFEITKEEVLELAARKLVDAFSDDSDLSEQAERGIRERIEKIVANGIEKKVDAVLAEEMTALLSKEIVPVDIWGDKAGKPTTIRAQLHERAKEFWNVRVDDQGRESSYGGRPRHEHLMAKILKDEFAKAVKENAEVIVAAFKTALKADAAKLVTEHIDRLIK